MVHCFLRIIFINSGLSINHLFSCAILGSSEFRLFSSFCIAIFCPIIMTLFNSLTHSEQMVKFVIDDFSKRTRTDFLLLQILHILSNLTFASSELYIVLPSTAHSLHMNIAKMLPVTFFYKYHILSTN